LQFLIAESSEEFFSYSLVNPPPVTSPDLVYNPTGVEGV